MPLIRRDTMNAAPADPRDPAHALRDGTADERWSAARALAVAGDDSSAGANAKTLADALRTESDPRVREAIFTSLVRIGGRECAEAVIPCLRADDPGLRGGALDALRA